MGDLAISADGKLAAYAIRQSNLQKDKRISTLYIIDLQTRQSQRVAESDWIADIQSIPGTHGFSFRSDFGAGTQVYKVDDHAVSPVVVNKFVDAPGETDLPMLKWDELNRPEGVVNYGWSPDGRSIWYSTPRPISKRPGDRINKDAIYPIGFRHALVDLHVRRLDGADIIVGQSEGSLSFGRTNIAWSSDSKEFSFVSTLKNSSGEDESSATTVNLDTGVASVLARERVAKTFDNAPSDSSGHKLAVVGYGAERDLVVAQTNDAARKLGRVGFKLGGYFTQFNSNSQKIWKAPTGEYSILAVRFDERDQRDGLILIDRSDRVREIEANGSLTHCTFSNTVSTGICVRQKMTVPPVLVSVNPGEAKVEDIASLAPWYDEISPLRVEPRIWTNKYAQISTGFVVFPRGYVQGKRYPAILVTHFVDADETFVNADFQWEYPIQVWAERGYIVVCANEPSRSQSEALTMSFQQWIQPVKVDQRYSTQQMQDLIFFDPLSSLTAAVEGLDREGLIDAKRVGIAGYSRGSQMVSVAMTTSKVFAAASNGDGDIPNAATYWNATAAGKTTYEQIFGGSPYDEKTLGNYRRLSPSFRAAEASGPVLHQVSAVDSSEFYEALKVAKIPTELVRFDGKAHLPDAHRFQIPSNQEVAMIQNLDWFDFWLLGKEDTDPAKADQYARWRKLRADCPASVCNRQ